MFLLVIISCTTVSTFLCRYILNYIRKPHVCKVMGNQRDLSLKKNGRVKISGVKNLERKTTFSGDRGRVLAWMCYSSERHFWL